MRMMIRCATSEANDIENASHNSCKSNTHAERNNSATNDDDTQMQMPKTWSETTKHKDANDNHDSKKAEPVE